MSVSWVPRFLSLVLAVATASLTASFAEDLTVESVLQCDPSDRIPTVFRFSRNAKLEEIETLAHKILVQWPERWGNDERRYLLPVFVRWAELDRPGLQQFVEINRLQKLGYLYQAAIGFVDPPKPFEERLAKKFSDKVFQQWINADLKQARQWFEKNENRVPSSAKSVAICIAKKEGSDVAKKWADARNGMVSNQSALAGWLVAVADEEPEKAREQALKLPAGLARQEGLHAAILGMAKQDPEKSLQLISELGKKSDLVTQEIIRGWAQGDAEECFQFLARSVKNGVYIDDFFDSLADQGEINEAVEFIRKWDGERKKKPEIAPITRIERLTEILLISAPGLAAEIALLTEDEKSTTRALQTLAAENPEKAIKLVKDRSGSELDAVARILIETRPDLAEDFLFATHPETVSLARSRVRFLVNEILKKPDQAAKIFQLRMPDWDVAISSHKGEPVYEMKDSFWRVCAQFGSSDLLKGKSFLLLLPNGKYRELALNTIARHAYFHELIAIEPDPLMIELVREATQFSQRIGEVERVIYRDAIYAGMIDKKTGKGEDYWNDQIDSVCKTLAKIETKAFREKVLTETIIPALEKLGWSHKIEKEIAGSELSDSEKSLLRANLNRAKKAPSGDPIADPFLE